MSNLASVRHGRITVSVPSGWEDDTTVSFLGPVKQHAGSGAIPLSERSRSTFGVSVERLPAGILGPRDFLERLGEGLKAAGARLRDLALEPFEVGGRQGYLADREVELPDGKIRQLMAAVIVGPDVVLATTAADAAVFEHEKASLLEMLAAVRID